MHAPVNAHRCLLYVPGDSERKLAKSATVAVDVVIADLEDAVVADRKALARELVARALGSAWRPGTERYVRINPVGGADWRSDIDATIAAAPDGYVIPKVDGPEDVARVVEHLAAATHGRQMPMPSLAAIVTESARGCLNAVASIEVSDAVVDVLWGAEDLAASIGARVSRDDAGRYASPFDHVRARILLEAKALGRRAIDAPFLVLGDEQGLRREALEAAAMGFDGKQAIHPDHVPIIDEAFRPTDEQVARARELVEAFDASGAGAFAFDGAMVDPPHLKAARRILELADGR